MAKLPIPEIEDGEHFELSLSTVVRKNWCSRRKDSRTSLGLQEQDLTPAGLQLRQILLLEGLVMLFQCSIT